MATRNAPEDFPEHMRNMSVSQRKLAKAEWDRDHARSLVAAMLWYLGGSISIEPELYQVCKQDGAVEGVGPGGLMLVLHYPPQVPGEEMSDAVTAQVLRSVLESLVVFAQEFAAWEKAGGNVETLGRLEPIIRTLAGFAAQHRPFSAPPPRTRPKASGLIGVDGAPLPSGAE